MPSTTIATEIISQLGGRRFIAMTGAKDMMNTGNGLQFSLPRFAGLKINKVRITLDDDDTYTVEFGRYAKLEYKTLKVYSGVYNDMLRALFTEVTGLEVSL